MLELKLVKESLFLNVLEAILDLDDVANVECCSTGLKLQAVDTEHIAIIDLLFPAEDFQHYHCDEYISMGIPIADMVKAISCADKDDTITIKISKENFDTITLLFESPKENNTTTDYDLPGLAGCISVTEKGLNFFALGIIGDLSIDYMQPEEATATVVTMRAPVSLFFDVKYLNSFSKAPTLFNQVKICLSTTQPLMVECKIGQMGYIKYFLAADVKTEIEEEEIKKIKRKRSKRNDKDEGSGEKKEGSKEIKGSREDKEGTKDEGIKEREDPKNTWWRNFCAKSERIYIDPA
uniref:Uncharacterized protein n=1 Tax=Avena sativa TaxID=4498 RepID=A0ACD5X9G4_AVESA